MSCTCKQSLNRDPGVAKWNWLEGEALKILRTLSALVNKKWVARLLIHRKPYRSSHWALIVVIDEMEVV